MAGNYPDAPGPRMAYDRDGTVGFTYEEANASVVQLTSGQLQAMNDEGGSDTTIGIVNNFWVGLIFPQLRDITGYFVHDYQGGYGNPIPSNLDTTTNSTNGLDGTWTTRVNPFVLDGTPIYRTGIHAVSYTSVKGIRWRFSRPNSGAYDDLMIRYLHLYGSINAGQTPNRVRIWHPTLDQALDTDPAYLDWGDVPQNSTATRQFRVKNISSTLTAYNTVVSLGVPTDTSPSLATQFQLSFDNSTWSSSVQVTQINPGAISPVIYIKRTTPSNATLSLWMARVIAAPGSMT